MNQSKIAITLYGLRNFCQTAEDLSECLRRLKSIGYDAVQVSGIGKIEAEVVREILDSRKMICCASHDNIENLTEHLSETIKRLLIWGCPFTALGSPNPAWQGEKRAADLAVALGQAAAEMKKHGLRLGYHNHDFEFEKSNGTTVLEKVLMHPAAAGVEAELDLHWVTRGGGSPAAWIEKFKNRLKVVHCKDFRYHEGKPIFCEAGQGNLDWPEIAIKIKEAGVEWCVVEQDEPVPGRDLYVSAEIARSFLGTLGLG